MYHTAPVHTRAYSIEIDFYWVPPPHQCGEQPHVRLGEHIPGDEPLRRQNRLHFIKGVEELGHCLVVRALRHRKAALVHPIVDAVINPLVDSVDLGAKRLRVQVERGVLCELVEARAQIADNFRRLIAHDAPCRLIPQDGHSKSRADRGAHFVVQVPHELGAVEVIDSALVRGPGRESAHAGRVGQYVVVSRERPPRV